jgi:hypothetical protein
MRCLPEEQLKYKRLERQKRFRFYAANILVIVSGVSFAIYQLINGVFHG